MHRQKAHAGLAVQRAAPSGRPSSPAPGQAVKVLHRPGREHDVRGRPVARRHKRPAQALPHQLRGRPTAQLRQGQHMIVPCHGCCPARAEEKHLEFAPVRMRVALAVHPVQAAHAHAARAGLRVVPGLRRRRVASSAGDCVGGGIGSPGSLSTPSAPPSPPASRQPAPTGALTTSSRSRRGRRQACSLADAALAARFAAHEAALPRLPSAARLTGSCAAA